MIREAFGIIYPDLEIPNLRELVEERTVGALPIGGKYRTIDFPLSNMVNSDIRSVGVIVSRKYNSLMDHLGSGKAWDLSGKNEGLFILTPYSLRENPGVYRGMVEALRSSLNFVRKARQEYCVIAGAMSIYNFNYSSMMRFHLESEADITALYHEVDTDYSVDEQSLEVFFELSDDARIRSIEVNPTLTTLTAHSLKSYIIRKDILINLVEECYAKGEYKFSENLLRNNLDRLRIMAYEHKGYVGPLKSVQSYFDLNMALLDPKVREELFQEKNRIFTKAKDSVPAKYYNSADVKGSLIANECIIEGSVENSILFRNVHVGRGAKVKNSILLPSVDVREGAELEYVILDKGVNVKRKSRLIGNENYPIVVGKGGTV
ncbi:MAG: glucose-1-phosphate adenylyltransferase subunit GlgD [Coriobacteriales bacterium]|jgi:glucose-1-phosphate adenylyltransferase|nr:glucose-1-phosphate adenylyltransferase subunit GlgD [Coriobacteriales bacterium]